MTEQIVVFRNFVNAPKNIFIFIISFYIQPDGGPLGAKHVAYNFTTNVLSLLVIY